MPLSPPPEAFALATDYIGGESCASSNGSASLVKLPSASDRELSGAGGVCRDHRSAVFSAAHVEWGTPPDLKAALDKEFRFTLDPCTPGQVWDGLAISWVGHRVFCNPPYGRKAKVEKWLAKGREAECAVFLLPARTDTGWFHDYALKADEIRFIRGRLKFVDNHRICPKETWLEGAPFPSVLVVFRAGGGGGFENLSPAETKPNVRISDGEEHAS